MLSMGMKMQIFLISIKSCSGEWHLSELNEATELGKML